MESQFNHMQSGCKPHEIKIFKDKIIPLLREYGV